MVAQPHRYRCETCTHWDKNKRPHTICQLTNDALEGEDIAFIERHGCCSHSQHQSAEQRIADAIKELERRESEADAEAHRTAPGSGHFQEARFMSACGKVAAFKEAIALLREEK